VNETPRTVLVTAGAGNVGRGIVARFHAEGARVIAADIDGDALAALQLELPGIETIEADIATPEGADRAIASAGDGLAVLCNNAGLIETATLAQIDEAVWLRVLSVNLTGPFLMSKRAVPIMIARGGGVIVNTGSIASLRGGRAGPAYTASKHGLLGLTQNIAAEYAAAGIRCNLVCPGSIERSEAAPPPAIEQANPDFIHRAGPARVSVDEIAALVSYLASDAARQVNGVAIPLDGGALAI
jgi:NAD(P)-dependent dehydrogenase (short-subunit alcohol dehydrogenase family)